MYVTQSNTLLITKHPLKKLSIQAQTELIEDFILSTNKSIQIKKKNPQQFRSTKPNKQLLPHNIKKHTKTFPFIINFSSCAITNKYIYTPLGACTIQPRCVGASTSCTRVKSKTETRDQLQSLFTTLWIDNCHQIQFQCS